MKRFVVSLVAAALLLPSGPREAPARSRVSTGIKLRVIKLARKGKRAFTQRRYQDALRHYRQAYALWPKPQLLYNLALACHRLKRPARAMTYVREFLAENAKSRQRRALVRAVLRLRRKLARQVGYLVLKGGDGARALVDGELVGTVPAEIVVRPGRRKLEFRAEGRPVVRREVDVEAGQTRTVEVVFPRLRPRPPPRGVGDGPAPGGRRAAEPAHRRRGLHMAYALTLAGVAVALAGAAVGTGMMVLQKHDAFQDDPTLANRDRVKLLANTTNGLWGAAGAVGVAAVVLAIFTRWRSGGEPAERPRVGLGVSVGSGAAGVSVQGRF